MFNYPDIKPELIKEAEEVLESLKETFDRIDDISDANQYKVLNAFRKNRISDAHLGTSTGYGYNDIGRDALEQVYADIFHTEDALVRPQITCGTHAIYLALSANLLPGDELIYISGKPYDSLEKAIGIVDSPLSLKEFGISFNYVDLIDESAFDFDAVRAAITDKTKIIAIQRSKGYKDRISFSPEQIGEAVKFIKSINSQIIVFVDNCYGEFVYPNEPTDYGVDLCVGSLIKNPGGGLAPIGGYIVGRADLIERCAYKLTSPGLGKEVGASIGVLRSFYQGLSLAPSITAQALKNAHFAAALFDRHGFRTSPEPLEQHGCIVQAIDFDNPDKLKRFCKAIQAASYIDSFVSPEDCDMPGYEDTVIMASGSFISGSSIELSADGPMRPPYTAYFQGGLTFEQGKYALLSALQDIEF